jgi:hypothetical protein
LRLFPAGIFGLGFAFAFLAGRGLGFLRLLLLLLVLACSLSTVRCCSQAVISCNKDVDDADKVFSELLLSISGVVFRRKISLVENHEFDSVLGKDPLDELESEPAEPISMGNDHFLNASSVDAFQKGKKPFAGEVDAASNVLDEFVVGVALLEVVDLSLEVFSLLVGGDSSVDDFRFRDEWSSSSFGVFTKHGLNIGEVVEPFATGTSDNANHASVCPSA